jgi:hypothetical protein
MAITSRSAWALLPGAKPSEGDQAMTGELKDGEKIIITHRNVWANEKRRSQGEVLTIGAKADVTLQQANTLVGMKRASTDLSWKEEAKPTKEGSSKRSSKEKAD